MAAENKKVLQGEVLSNKMDKTIVVAIKSRTMHPLYKKFIGVTKKVVAHDKNNEANIGDTVKIIESRPLSKRKRWAMISIVSRVQ